MRLRVTALVPFLLAGASQNAAAKDIVGVWLTDKGKGKVEITKCGTELCSKIIWLREPKDERGRALRDIYNPDPKLRRRPIIGLPIMTGLAPVGPKQWEGHIYNPEDGKTYIAKVTLMEPDLILLKGCMSMGWPCGRKYWNRTKDPRPRQQIAARSKPKAKVKPKPPAVAATATRAPAQQRPAIRPVAQAAPSVASAPARPAPKPKPKPAAPKTAMAPLPWTVTAMPPEEPSQPIATPPAAAPLPWASQSVRPAPPPSAAAPRPAAPPPAPAPVATARATPTTPPTARQTDPVPIYVVQLSARRTETGAAETFADLQQQFPELLATHRPDIRRADLGDKGVWFRVRVGPMRGKSAAVDFCDRLKSAGGKCIVSRY